MSLLSDVISSTFSLGGPATRGRRRAAERHTVTADDVSWAYRLLLDREPENASVVSYHLKHPGRRALVREILQSEEFQGTHPTATPIGRFLDEPHFRVETAATQDQLDAMLARTAGAWRTLGDREPHYSVLTDDRFLAGNIDANRKEFYDSGFAQVRQLLAALARNRVDLGKLRRTIDYGCGVGRMTVPLASHFASVTAIDVSTRHIEHARQWAAANAITNVDFRELCDLSDLGALGAVDFIFTIIVLQHNPPPVIIVILEKLLNALRPGGCGYFQVPTYIDGYTFHPADYLSAPAPEMEMHAVPQHAVFEVVRGCGCNLLEVREDTWTGSPEMLSHTFLVQRQ